MRACSSRPRFTAVKPKKCAPYKSATMPKKRVFPGGKVAHGSAVNPTDYK